MQHNDLRNKISGFEKYIEDTFPQINNDISQSLKQEPKDIQQLKEILSLIKIFVSNFCNNFYAIENICTVRHELNLIKKELLTKNYLPKIFSQKKAKNIL